MQKCKKPRSDVILISNLMWDSSDLFSNDLMIKQFCHLKYVWIVQHFVVIKLTEKEETN